MSTSQSFITEYLSSLGPSNEWVIANRSHQTTTIINSFSSDQFYPYKINQNEHAKQCKQYEMRQIYALPNTPKIIMVRNNVNNGDVMVMAQRGQFSIGKIMGYVDKDYRNQLEIVTNVVQSVEMLQKKYGYFRLTEGMLRFSKGPALLVWINQSQIINIPQYPISAVEPFVIEKADKRDNSDVKYSPMSAMVVSLLDILVNKMSHNLAIRQLLEERKDLLTFQLVRKKIREELKDQTTSQCTIYTLSAVAQKNRRNTEQKRKQIPHFLLNKPVVRTHQKYESCLTGESYYKKSAITYVNSNQFKSQTYKQIKSSQIPKYGVNRTNENIKKMQKNNYLLAMLIKNRNKSSRYKQNQLQTSGESIRYCEQNQILQGTKQFSGRKTVTFVRESTKSISMQSMQTFEMSSSGKKTQVATVSDQDTASTSCFLKTTQKRLASTFGKTSPKNTQLKPNTMTRQIQLKVSKIIQQNLQQHHLKTPSLISPRSNINNFINNTSTLTQQSISSPGSDFYKDVDNILHNQGRFNRCEELDVSVKSIEGELNKILFD